MIKTLGLSPALKESRRQLHGPGEKSCHPESGLAVPEAGPSSKREQMSGRRLVWVPKARGRDRGKTTAVMGDGPLLGSHSLLQERLKAGK